MADIIGILGENDADTIGTQTVYTCPSGKAAKFKVMFYGQVGSGGASTLEVKVNGMRLFTSGAVTASHYIFTSTAAIVESGSAAPTGADAATTVAPCPQEYYVSQGDTVTYTIGGEDFTSLDVFVVGAEVDIT